MVVWGQEPHRRATGSWGRCGEVEGGEGGPSGEGPWPGTVGLFSVLQNLLPLVILGWQLQGKPATWLPSFASAEGSVALRT